jgi:hypothetical protein
MLEIQEEIVIKDNNFFKRRGRFKISWDLIHQSPGFMLAILSNVVVVRTENDFMTNVEFGGDDT